MKKPCDHKGFHTWRVNGTGYLHWCQKCGALATKHDKDETNGFTWNLPGSKVLR